MAVHLHQFDLPDDVSFADQVAVDTETTGLDLNRDRLCVVQLSAGDGDAHLVHFPRPEYKAPNLCRLLANENVTKLFLFARFAVAMLGQTMNVICRPIYCTKIASKLVRTYTDRHGLKDLCSELIGVDLSKKQQSSDWAAETLSEAQQAYAANDVLHLHKLREKLDAMLQREGRDGVAEACFDFLEVRAALDLAGWDGEDIFAH